MGPNSRSRPLAHFSSPASAMLSTTVMTVVLLLCCGVSAEQRPLASAQDDPVVFDIFVAPSASACTTYPMCGQTIDCPCGSLTNGVSAVNYLINNGTLSIARGDWANLLLSPGVYPSGAGNSQINFQSLPISIMSLFSPSLFHSPTHSLTPLLCLLGSD